MVTPEGEGWRQNTCTVSYPHNLATEWQDMYYSNFESETSIVQRVFYNSVVSRTQVFLCTVSHVPGSRLFSLPCRTRTGSSAQIVVDPWKESAFFVSPISLCGENCTAIWWSGYSLTARVPLDRQSLLLLGRQWSVSFANDDLIYLCRVETVTFWV